MKVQMEMDPVHVRVNTHHLKKAQNSQNNRNKKIIKM